MKKTNIYGTHAVTAAILNPDRHVHTIYATKQTWENLSQSENLKKYTRLIEYVDNKKLDQLCPKGAVHQGIAIDASDLPFYTAQDLIIRGHDKDISTILMLDQITDPRNVGAIIRSAAAFGVNGIVMQSKHAPQLDGVLAKAASGALERVAVATETNLSRAIETFQKNNYFIYGLDERGDNIRTLKPHTHRVLVLGAEGAGLRRLVKENCDALVKIPMAENSVESLNVSNAAAVSLYALYTD